ncbi:hypothetical protein [Frankia sp. AvcI1]|nr:hypothetical protein [Frankia sp. AvcI1]
MTTAGEGTPAVGVSGLVALRSIPSSWRKLTICSGVNSGARAAASRA